MADECHICCGNIVPAQLTDLERQYLHKRIAEEQAEVERLAREGDPGSQAPRRNPKQTLEEVRQPQD
jgi:hypothetical protein